MSVFGPIPSRRLGQSLGINNLDERSCTYSCVYCQAGATRRLTIRRSSFGPSRDLAGRVTEAVEQHRANGRRIDYLTFVPDGEPTLDRDLGSHISSLRPLGIPIAVITNGSLLWDEEVRGGLVRADWVSLKVDTVDDAIWRRVNRPHGRLDLTLILSGLSRFAGEFRGTLATETMLVRGLNDSQIAVTGTARFVTSLSPSVSYLSIPLRPPAEPWVLPPEEGSLVRAHEIFRSAGAPVELLSEDESGDFGLTGDAEEGILNTLAVHPMPEEAIDQLLSRAGASRSALPQLVRQGRVLAVSYAGRRYFVRPSGKRRGNEL